MRRVSLLVAAFLLVASLAACNDKGQPCSHRGDTRATGGEVLRCTRVSGGGLQWQ